MTTTPASQPTYSAAARMLALTAAGTDPNATIEFEVVGKPAPQGSKRLVNGHVIENNWAALTVWRDAVAIAARRRNAPMFTDATWATITFRLPRPRTVPATRRRFPRVVPDLDKLARSTLDGLVMGQLLADDALVCMLWTSKLYCLPDELPGAEISIGTL